MLIWINCDWKSAYQIARGFFLPRHGYSFADFATCCRGFNVSYSVLGFLFILLLVVGIIAATARIALTGQVAVVARVRSGLREQMKNSRLLRMLGRRGIALQDYLDRSETADIKTQIGVCDTCPQTQRCDTVLANPEPAVDDFSSFCPNAPAIKKLAETD